MSLQRRDALVDNIIEAQPELQAFVREVPRRHDLILGEWDLLSYSFQKGFETLWDDTQNDQLLVPPLLLLWRQSVELALKAALMEITGSINGKPGHDLAALFKQLIDALAALGHCIEDELTMRVRSMISIVQSLDPFADHFRYPSTKTGKLFDEIAVDLDELFQAHWIIVTYCEGAATEVEESRRTY